MTLKSFEGLSVTPGMRIRQIADTLVDQYERAILSGRHPGLRNAVIAVAGVHAKLLMADPRIRGLVALEQLA